MTLACQTETFTQQDFTSWWLGDLVYAKVFSTPRPTLDGTFALGNNRRDMRPTVQALLVRWPWRPIRNCPGRFVLPWTEDPRSFETLLGPSDLPQEFSSSAAKDEVLVVPLDDGGLISYRQPDGRLIHTLNTREGFVRKLHQLGITVKDSPKEHRAQEPDSPF